MGDKQLLESVERIESKIFVLRGQKVMLDEELAALYEVEIKALNQALRPKALNNLKARRCF